MRSDAIRNDLIACWTIGQPYVVRSGRGGYNLQFLSLDLSSIRLQLASKGILKKNASEPGSGPVHRDNNEERGLSPDQVCYWLARVLMSSLALER